MGTGQRLISNYKVIIYMTRGEQSDYCQTTGHSGYEGPSSPSSAELWGTQSARDRDEYWLGYWTTTCKNARIAGTLNFFSNRASYDASVPGGGFNELSPPTLTGNTLAGVAPRRYDSICNCGTPITSRGVKVYDAVNGMGTLVFFDLGDQDVTKEEVQWAVQKVRLNRAAFGIPTNLGEYNAVGAYSHIGSSANCPSYPHNDHRAVHDALWQYDIFSAPQHGNTCAGDPDLDSGRTKSLTSSEFASILEGSTTTRVGTFQRRYGWLLEGHWPYVNTTAERTDYFWTRFG